MSEISAPNYIMTNPSWYWLYNYKNQCWDKAETGLDGSVTVYQWDKELKRYTRKIYFKEVSFAFYHTPTENDFAYWYGIPNGIDSLGRHDFINPYKEKDKSCLGQVWKFYVDDAGKNGEWCRVDEDANSRGKIDPTKETYIICHGLKNSFKEPWVKEMATELAKRNPNAQILCVDWGDESKHATLQGDFTASYIDESAARAAILLSQLLGTYSSDYTLANIGASGDSSANRGTVDVNLGGFEKKITWIGHSFGAHQGAWFSEFIGRGINTIVGLDSAEEDALKAQKNEIILDDQDIADNVFFYKTSSMYGGDDDLGHYSFVALEEGVSYINHLDCIRYTAFWNAHDHGYATDFYEFSMPNGSGVSAGYPLTLLYNGSKSANTSSNYYEDLKKLLAEWRKSSSSSGWIGVIDDISGRIEGLTQGYTPWRKYDGKSVSWDYKNYKTIIEDIADNVDGAAKWYIPLDGSKLDANIIAVKYLTDYSFCNTEGEENEAIIEGKGIKDSTDDTYKLTVGSTYKLSTTIYNYADNIAFGRNGNEASNAQKELNSSWEVWLSTDEKKLDTAKNSIRLSSHTLNIEPTNLDTENGTTTATSVGQEKLTQKFSISEKQLEKLLGNNSDLMAKYNRGEEITLYLYRRAGADSKSAEYKYVKGELYSDDNVSEATKITVQKGVDVTFVIDVSGSMGGEIDALKAAMMRYIEAIRDSGKKTKMTLITFFDEPGTQKVELTTTDAEAMLGAVSRLTADGGISPGEISLHALQTAIEMADENSHIIMVTDEEAYPGVNSHNLMTLAANKNIQISSSVVGVFPVAYNNVRNLSLASASPVQPAYNLSSVGDEGAVYGVSEKSSDDTMDEAIAMTLKQTVTGSVGYINDDEYYYYYTFDSCDWYKIDLQKDTQYWVGFQSDLEDVYVSLFNEGGQVETGSTSVGNSFTFTPVASGTYYLRVKYDGYECGVPYSLKVNELAEMEDVQETSPNQTVTGTVHYADNYSDWVKIDLQKHYLYSFNIQSENAAVMMSLYEGDGQTEIAFLESGEGYTFSPDASGTYYMRVRATDFVDTSYSLNIKQLAEPSELGTTLESFSIISAETGGNFVAMPYADYSNSHIHESLYYNFLMSIDNPVVMTCGPNSVPCGTTVTLTVNGSGTNWRAGQTQVSFNSEDITVKSVDVTSATSLQVKLEISDSCELNAYDISVTCGNEVAQGFGVLSVESQPVYSQIVSVSSNRFERGKDFVVTIQGYDTNWTQDTVEVDMGPGVTISEYEVISATEIKVYGSVSESATLGYRNVSVSDGDTYLDYVGALFVTSTTLDAPSITSITPDALEAGTITEMLITGKNLDFNTSTLSIDLGEGIEILETTVVDSVTLKVKVQIDKSLPSGFRDVRLTIDGRVCVMQNGIDITAAAVIPEPVYPEIRLESPGPITAGTEATLILTGRNVDFTSSKVTFDFGSGVTVKSMEVVDSQTLKVTVVSDAATAEGYRDVKVTIDDWSTILPDCIDVTVANDALTQAIDLAFASDNRAYRVDSLGASDTVDYFRITPAESRAYRVGVESSELLQQVVLSVGTKADDGSFAVVRSIVVDSDALVEEISGLALAAGKEYYIAVQTNGIGADTMQTPYTLRIDPCGNMLVTDDNTAATANKLSWGESAEPANRSWVGYGDAEDYYLFTLDGTSDVRLAVSELTSAARVTIHKENAAGGLTQVSTHSVRSGGLDHTMSLTSGSYFVEIASYDNGAGRYNTTYALELEKEEANGNKEFAVANG